MKKRFSPKQLLPSKKVIMAIAAAACVTAFSIGGVHYYNTNLKETATTATYYNQYLAASGADEVITDQVKDYISNYFQTMNVKEFISQDEMAQIIAQISTGVMNRLPTDTLSSGQELKVKEMISKAVFIGFPDYDSSKNFLAVTFIKQVYVALAQKCGKKGKCTRRVKMVVDEAGNMPKIEDLRGMVTIGLGRNIFFDFYIQSLQQFESVYGKDGEIIYGNCGNKVYLMAGDDDTPEKFSKQIGTETVTDLQRTGSMFSLSKHFMESSLEKRLISANQLQELREGEAVIKRTMKRTDNHGNPIKPTPIFNSLDTGTAFKYRYQYLTDDFPNADEIDLDDVNTESREYINLKNRVWDPEISFRQMAQEKLSENGSRLIDFPENVRDAVLKIMEKIKGNDYNKDEVLDMDITAIKSIINADNYLKNYEKKAIIITINSVGGGKQCEDSVKKEN